MQSGSPAGLQAKRAAHGGKKADENWRQHNMISPVKLD
jgi:hypothetical protein